MLFQLTFDLVNAYWEPTVRQELGVARGMKLQPIQ